MLSVCKLSSLQQGSSLSLYQSEDDQVSSSALEDRGARGHLLDKGVALLGESGPDGHEPSCAVHHTDLGGRQPQEGVAPTPSSPHTPRPAPRQSAWLFSPFFPAPYHSPSHGQWKNCSARTCLILSILANCSLLFFPGHCSDD